MPLRAFMVFDDAFLAAIMSGAIQVLMPLRAFMVFDRIDYGQPDIIRRGSVLMPLRAFMVFDRLSAARYEPIHSRVLMPLRAFMVFDVASVDRVGQLYKSLNALAGIYGF